MKRAIQRSRIAIFTYLARLCDSTLPGLDRGYDFDFVSIVPGLESVGVNVGVKINGREKGQR